MAADDQFFRGFVVDLAFWTHRGGIQQTQQFRKRFFLPVVRRSTRQDKGIGSRRKKPGQFVIQGAGSGKVMRFVDDYSVPSTALQMRPVPWSLERVARNECSVEVGKRGARSRASVTDRLDTHREQAHKRQGKARPHLVLHLL